MAVYPWRSSGVRNPVTWGAVWTRAWVSVWLSNSKRPERASTSISSHDRNAPVATLAADDRLRGLAPRLDVVPGGRQRPRPRRDAAGDEEHDALHAEAAQQGLPDAPEAAAPVVEGEQHRARGRRPGAHQELEVFGGGERDVVVVGQVLELAGERLRLQAVEHEHGDVAAWERAPGDEGRVPAEQEIARDFPRLARLSCERLQRHRGLRRGLARPAPRRTASSMAATHAGYRNGWRRRGHFRRGTSAGPHRRARGRCAAASAAGSRGRDEQAGHAVLQHLAAPVDRRRHDGAAGRHGLEQRERGALVGRGDAEHVERPQQRADVLAMAGKGDAGGDAEGGRLRLQRPPCGRRPRRSGGARRGATRAARARPRRDSGGPSAR